MNRTLLGIVFIASLIATGDAQSTRHAAAVQSGWRTYRSPGYGFTIDYPGDGSFTSGHRIEPQRSMIPVCDTTSVACFEYNGHAFDDTTLASLGVSVNILPDGKTKEDCYATGGDPVRKIVIHGTRFHVGETGGAATGSSEGGPVYLVFHRRACYEIALGTAHTDVAPEEYEEYGLHPLNQCELRALCSAQDEMNRMLHSFRFTGRVRNERVFRRQMR
jgi:hypothetical protein